MLQRLLEHLATIAHLALFGIVGFPIISLLIGLIGSGIAAIPAAGIGLIPLAVAALALYAIAVVERMRVGGLFRLAIPALPMRQSRRTDWLRIPATLGLQYIDGRNLRALGHVLIISLLGLLAIAALWLIGLGAATSFTPLVNSDATLFGLGPVPGFLWPLLGVALVIAGISALVGLSVTHRALSKQLMVPSREEELQRIARTADRRHVSAVRAADVERSRIERDLHDGVQPRLVSIGMTLGLARQKLDSDTAAAASLIDEAHASTKAAITELRQLARGIHTAVLDDRGLDAALSALAARSHIPVQLDVRLDRRCSRDAEAAMYFVIAEALTNAAKHAKSSTIRVAVRQRDDGTLWGRVDDDGIGGAQRVPGGGIDGIESRVVAARGSFALQSPTGGPTALEVSLPCAS